MPTTPLYYSRTVLLSSFFLLHLAASEHVRLDVRDVAHAVAATTPQLASEGRGFRLLASRSGLLRLLAAQLRQIHSVSIYIGIPLTCVATQRSGSSTPSTYSATSSVTSVSMTT